MNTNKSPIPVIDLFAGPGGLGEGFSSLNDGNAFRITVSAEKDSVAHQTLLLRAFFRLLKNSKPEALIDYYNYCNGINSAPFTENSKEIWAQAQTEAMCLEIGSDNGNKLLDHAIQNVLGDRSRLQPCVLIGGPPCQAYSLVGRSRNKGIVDYKPEEDKRHFLYREYLRIIQKNSPDVFVMENVKGILSSKINGDFIFHQILCDLANPSRALDITDDGVRYHIVSLVSDAVFKDGDDPKLLDVTKFIIKSEEYGIPQARHRVILLGIRSDRFPIEIPRLRKDQLVTVKEVIGELPKLRSKLSKQKDSGEDWEYAVRDALMNLYTHAFSHKGRFQEVAEKLKLASENLNSDCVGNLRCNMKMGEGLTGNSILDKWYLDENLNVWLNHETRGHRIDDLARYAFAACFTDVYRYSPKGHVDFCLPGLAPDHKNWESGKFSDRFRVQLPDSPSTTITSHISKDGHYFIHYDPTQCRSLTVREAARLQTFPDNYFFQGGRTNQYHQVGNAVPPLLANKIASLVLEILTKSSFS